MLKFNYKYLILAILLFLIEVIIALYAHDEIIRPYIGDVLVVILLYCLVKSFINASVISTALSVLAFSYLIEILQYFHYVEWFGLGENTLANIILGTSFAWTDLLAYTAGIPVVLLSEKMISNPQLSIK